MLLWSVFSLLLRPLAMKTVVRSTLDATLSKLGAQLPVRGSHTYLALYHHRTEFQTEPMTRDRQMIQWANGVAVYPRGSIFSEWLAVT